MWLFFFGRKTWFGQRKLRENQAVVVHTGYQRFEELWHAKKSDCKTTEINPPK